MERSNFEWSDLTFGWSDPTGSDLTMVPSNWIPCYTRRLSLCYYYLYNLKNGKKISMYHLCHSTKETFMILKVVDKENFLHWPSNSSDCFANCHLSTVDWHNGQVLCSFIRSFEWNSLLLPVLWNAFLISSRFFKYF